MAEIARDVDLSKLDGQPTERAELRLEYSSVEATFPGGARIKSTSKTYVDSPKAVAYTTLMLIIAGCLAATVPLAAGAPTWVPIVIGALLPPALFMLVRLGYQRWPR